MANNTPKNSQETKEQKQRTVSEKLQLAVAATLALMLVDLSSPTKLQQQYADRGDEISQSMKEIGSKAVDKMLVGLEKVVDAIGPTPAYAGGNPDEIDELFGDTKGNLEKEKKKNKEIKKEISQIQERNSRLQIIKEQIPFLTDIISGKVDSKSLSNQAKWRESRKKILDNLGVYPQDLQMEAKDNVRSADRIMGIK